MALASTGKSNALLVFMLAAGGGPGQGGDRDQGSHFELRGWGVVPQTGSHHAPLCDGHNTYRLRRRVKYGHAPLGYGYAADNDGWGPDVLQLWGAVEFRNRG